MGVLFRLAEKSGPAGRGRGAGGAEVLLGARHCGLHCRPPGASDSREILAQSRAATLHESSSVVLLS